MQITLIITFLLILFAFAGYLVWSRQTQRAQSPGRHRPQTVAPAPPETIGRHSQAA